MNTDLILKTRRQFLRTAALGASASWTVPAFLSRTFAALETNAANSSVQVSTGKDSPILVVLQMAGGNDGLNTVVPFTNDLYYKARPSLHIPTRDVIKLNDESGFHPALSGLQAMFEEGRLSIVHGVGYPNPNRSHFRSTEIWQTASDAHKAERHGWLGRYFDSACQGCDPTIGVSIGRQAPQAFVGPKPLGISLDNPSSYRFATADQAGPTGKASSERFFRELNRPQAGEFEVAETSAGDSVSMVAGRTDSALAPLDYLERVSLDAQISSDKILSITRAAPSQADYPPSALANSLRLVARLIGGELPTRVFYVSQGGYDTHTNQAPAQDRLLRDLGGALKAFLADLRAQGNADRVLVMTFSEFGRRVAQNANRGTDHGAAAPLFLIGPRMKSKFIGRSPSLAPQDLHQGDLKFTTDFRSIYASVLEKWLQTRSAPVLGRQFPPIDFI